MSLHTWQVGWTCSECYGSLNVVLRQQKRHLYLAACCPSARRPRSRVWCIRNTAKTDAERDVSAIARASIVSQLRCKITLPLDVDSKWIHVGRLWIHYPEKYKKNVRKVEILITGQYYFILLPHSLWVWWVYIVVAGYIAVYCVHLAPLWGL